MPVSGLVVTLSEEPERREAAVGVLAAEPQVTVGEPSGLRLPLVVEASTVAEHDALLEWIEDVDGVLFVELAYADLSDVASVVNPTRRRRRRPSPEV